MTNFMNKDYFFIKQMKLDVISFSTTEPAIHTGSYIGKYAKHISNNKENIEE
jgi:hypothetical protein